MRDAAASDLEVFSLRELGPVDDPAGRVLVEVPHGATEEAHYRAVRSRLRSDLPADLEEFFWVNTDVGASEVAAAAAERLADGGFRVVLLRGLVPRTFVDLNRSLAVGSDSYRLTGVTPSVPSYVDDPADRRWLARLHADYQAVCDRLYDEVVGSGGLAVALHTYAPRSIRLDDIDRDVVAGLRRAWAPERASGWPLRPEVDLITATPEGDVLADPELVAAVRGELEAQGLEVRENATYQLIPGTMAAERSLADPGRVLCLELRRDLLVEEWTPLRPLRIGPGAERLGEALARAIVARRLAGDALRVEVGPA